MGWLQLKLEIPGSDADALETLLENLGALSVSLTDAADEPLFEPLPGETPMWSQTIAGALFDESYDQAALAETIKQQFPNAKPEFSELEDREWLNEWKRDASPKQYGERLWVYPWDAPADNDDKVVIELEPGLAFGTGNHATTSMCLEWLDQNPPSDKDVIDYGCGSGLLAIAALKLGAKAAVGVDIDEQALIATRSNAEQNNVADRMTVEHSDTKLDVTCDLVVANILSGILVDLSATLKALLRDNAQLVLTGILAEQAETVQNAYADTVHLDIVKELDGWVLLAGQKH